MAKAGNPRSVIGIIKELDSNTKVIGLLILVAEALFTTAIFNVDHNQVFWAICVAAAFLAIMGVALVRLETRKIPATEHPQLPSFRAQARPVRRSLTASSTAQYKRYVALSPYQILHKE